jgi:hypothetical protein
MVKSPLTRLTVDVIRVEPSVAGVAESVTGEEGGPSTPFVVAPEKRLNLISQQVYK